MDLGGQIERVNYKILFVAAYSNNFYFINLNAALILCLTHFTLCDEYILIAATLF